MGRHNKNTHFNKKKEKNNYYGFKNTLVNTTRKMEKSKVNFTFSFGTDDSISMNSTDSDVQIDLENLTLTDGHLKKTSLSRSNSVSGHPCRSYQNINSRSKRKLCRLKAVYSRPSHSSSDSLNSLNEEKFLEKKNLEDLEILEKNQNLSFKSTSLNSSFTYGITTVYE